MGRMLLAILLSGLAGAAANAQGSTSRDSNPAPSCPKNDPLCIVGEDLRDKDSKLGSRAGNAGVGVSNEITKPIDKLIVPGGKMPGGVKSPF
jgi:hypothetical protein